MPPLEPDDDDGKEFEVNDVVGAFWLDGWWFGVVVKVLNAKTYSVFFDDPPDLLVLKRSALRPHWDWVGGRWVRSQIRLCPLVCIARRLIFNFCMFGQSFVFYCMMDCLGPEA